MSQVAIRSWGNSQGIRIPKDIMEHAGLSISDILEVTVEDGTIILKKAFRHRSFEERLAEYNGNISVNDFDWGEPTGKEML